jgi:hypothetical protein
MTQLLEQAFSEAAKLAAADQDAIAARWLAELEDERKWGASFAATTDGQWEKMLAEVRRDVAAGNTVPLTEVFGLDESEK